MSEKKSISIFKLFLLKNKSSRKVKSNKVKVVKPSNIKDQLVLKEPIWVRINENWIDHITKFAAFAAVLLALITVVFDCSQSKKQAEIFDHFENNIDSLLKSQIMNDSITIETLKQQQKLMKQQNDSTIDILKIQADRLETQNNIWKINQKNKILTERVKIVPSIIESKILNDTLTIKLSYLNKGLRTARNIECKFGVFTINNNQILLLQADEEAPFSMKNIIPESSVYWYIKKSFVSRKIDDKVILIYSKLKYEDEMFKEPFIITDFFRVLNQDSVTKYSFCSQQEIDFIEQNSHYRDIDFEDFTIKDEYIFK